jgi:PAS domain S-box-containing protein
MHDVATSDFGSPEHRGPGPAPGSGTAAGPAAHRTAAPLPAAPPPPPGEGGPTIPPRELGRLLDQVPIGIVSFDADAHVRFLNRHAKEELRVRARDVVGSHVGVLFPGAEDDVGTLVAHDAAGPPETRLIRCARPDGHHWLDVVVTGFTAPGGATISVLLLQDVTARVTAELAVRESHQLLSAVTEGTSDILFVKDDTGRYLMINGAGAARVGRSPEDCIGAHVRDLYDPESAERIIEHDRAVMAAGETHDFEEVIAPIGGERRVYLATKSPYRDPDGRVIGVVGVARDITERKRAEERLQMLATAGELFSGSLDYGATFAAVAHAAVPTFADGCIIDVVRAGEQLDRLAVVHEDPAWEEQAREVARRWGFAPLGADALPGDGASRCEPEVDPAAFAAHAVDDEHRAALERLCPRSLLTVPLAAGDAQLLGALTFVTGPSARRFDGADLQLAEDLGRRAATAVAHARLQAERAHIARTLQESLLPPRLPEVPGARIASRFHAAGAAHEVGGDFYDLFALPDGRFLLVIGDVCGKGAEAAAVTALARYTIRGSAMRETSPTRLLEVLNEALLHQEVGGFCSVLCARLEPADDGMRMVMASGGHPLPLLLRTAGSSDELGRLGTLLGVLHDPELPESEHAVEPGETVVFYTDGVSEAGAPERLMDVGELTELSAPWVPWGAEAVAARLDAAALAAGGDELRDDLALVIVELPVPLPADGIRVSAPTGPKLARSLRAALEPLRDGLGRQTFATVRLLVDELVANAERHGTPAPGAPVGLEISCTDDKVRIAVTDTGSGFSPPRRPSEPAGPGGWGLLAVDRLGRRWGVQREPLATVWVEVSR